LSASTNVPRIIRNAPPTIETILRYFDIFPRYASALLILKAMRRSGTARPSEKVPKRNALDRAVVEVLARRRMDPNIGPTQGVHPREKALPNKNDPNRFPRLKILGTRKCCSLLRRGIFKTPTINNPKIMIEIPAIRESHTWYGANA